MRKLKLAEKELKKSILALSEVEDGDPSRKKKLNHLLIHCKRDLESLFLKRKDSIQNLKPLIRNRLQNPSSHHRSIPVEDLERELASVKEIEKLIKESDISAE